MVYLEGKNEERQSILGSIKAVGPKVYEYLVKFAEIRCFNFAFSGKSLSFSHADSSAGEEHFHSGDGYRLHLSRIFDILPGWWQKTIKVEKINKYILKVGKNLRNNFRQEMDFQKSILT